MEGIIKFQKKNFPTASAVEVESLLLSASKDEITWIKKAARLDGYGYGHGYGYGDGDGHGYGHCYGYGGDDDGGVILE